MVDQEFGVASRRPEIEGALDPVPVLALDADDRVGGMRRSTKKTLALVR
jgi:hypothetical protein